MLKKVFRALAYIILIFIPFSPILENFFPTVSHENFSGYLLGCSIIAILMILLALFLSHRNSDTPVKISHELKLPAWLLFLLGIIVLPPLHMGPPTESAALLQSAALERFRYGMLLLSVGIFAAAILTILIKVFRPKFISMENAVLLPMIVAIPILIWDNYDSFMFSSRLTEWTGSGKKADEFFPSYNFHQGWRAAGRSMLYVIAAYISILLHRRSILTRWGVTLLNLFCIAGAVFCILSVTIGPSYYFPFMVPAIAMAPSYWIGLILLQRQGKNLRMDI